MEGRNGTNTSGAPVLRKNNFRQCNRSMFRFRCTKLSIIDECLFQSGQFSEDMIPTVGFNMRKITKGNVTIKVWDIGGQPRFRSMWERYCRGVNAIV